MLTVFNTANAPQVIGPYSQAIRASGFIFCSGQIPLNTDGSMVADSIEAQTKQVLENLKIILEAAGSGMEMVVKTTIFLIDMNDFATVNEIYGTYFHTSPPARSTVQVAQLPKGARVEIEAIALEGIKSKLH